MCYVRIFYYKNVFLIKSTMIGPSSHGSYFHPLIVQNEFDLSGTISVRNETHNIYVIVVEVDK